MSGVVRKGFEAGLAAAMALAPAVDAHAAPEGVDRVSAAVQVSGTVLRATGITDPNAGTTFTVGEAYCDGVKPTVDYQIDSNENGGVARAEIIVDGSEPSEILQQPFSPFALSVGSKVVSQLIGNPGSHYEINTILNDVRTNDVVTGVAPNCEPQIEVTATEPQVIDKDGTANDRYIIDSIDGVEYHLGDANGEVLEPGEHTPSSTKVTITATPASKEYVLTGPTTFELDFTNVQPTPTDKPPVDPTPTDKPPVDPTPTKDPKTDLVIKAKVVKKDRIIGNVSPLDGQKVTVKLMKKGPNWEEVDSKKTTGHFNFDPKKGKYKVSTPNTSKFNGKTTKVYTLNK